MADSKLPEVWLRGPLPHLSAYLQPVAHALLQAREEVNKALEDFPDELLWEKPAGVASVGFHMQHLTGVLDRLFTYAKELPLNDQQLAALREEGKPFENSSVQVLLQVFNEKVDWALEEMKNTPEHTLTEFRAVGRAQLPSTVLGLLFHAAEHTMRHTGQLLVTIRIQK